MGDIQTICKMINVPTFVHNKNAKWVSGNKINNTAVNLNEKNFITTSFNI